MAKYFMEFEKGGRFEIELDYDAPMTAAAFKAFMEENNGYQALCLQGDFLGKKCISRQNWEQKKEKTKIPNLAEAVYISIRILSGLQFVFTGR